MASMRSERQTSKGPCPTRTAHKLKSRLLAALEERELSRSQLSFLTEIPYKALRRLFRQDVDPSLEYALRISHVLGIEVEEIFALEPRPIGTDRPAREDGLGRRHGSAS